MYKKILVPLDGSKRAEAILPHVEELAHRFDAKIVFLEIIEPIKMFAPTAFVKRKDVRQRLPKQHC